MSSSRLRCGWKCDRHKKCAAVADFPFDDDDDGTKYESERASESITTYRSRESIVLNILTEATDEATATETIFGVLYATMTDNLLLTMPCS